MDYTVNDAAPLLGIKPGSVRALIAREHLAATKRGRDWFITEEEIARYNRERKKPGPRPHAKSSGGGEPKPTPTRPSTCQKPGKR